MLDEQRSQVEKVLVELGVSGKPTLEVLNKADLIGARQRHDLAGRKDAMLVSGLAHTGLDALLAAIDDALVADPLIESAFRVPQSEGAVLASLEAGATIESKRFEGNLIFLLARGPASLLNRFRRFRERHM